MGVANLVTIQRPILLLRPRLICCNSATTDGLSAVQHISKNGTMRMVYGVQSFHSASKGMIWCKTRSPHARTNEDGPSSQKSGFQREFLSLLESTVDAVRIFPWEKVYARFIQRVLDLFWIAAKWLAIPVLALSTLSEFVYTLSAGKDLFIPLGILSGVLVAKIVGKASLEVVKELQDVKTPWPLVVIGLLFILLKLPGPYYPSWAAAFLPHVANAGLVQTMLLFREWQQISV